MAQWSQLFQRKCSQLCYLPTLFGYLTGTDFLQHPWYKNGGIGVAYTWLPGSLSAGFGDGHEKRNGKPLRIRSAFADFLARTTGDPYAAWYSAVNNRYDTEFEPVSTVSHPPSSARPIVNFRRIAESCMV